MINTNSAGTLKKLVTGIEATGITGLEFITRIGEEAAYSYLTIDLPSSLNAYCAFLYSFNILSDLNRRDAETVTIHNREVFSDYNIEQESTPAGFGVNANIDCYKKTVIYGADSSHYCTIYYPKDLTMKKIFFINDMYGGNNKSVARIFGIKGNLL